MATIDLGLIDPITGNTGSIAFQPQMVMAVPEMFNPPAFAPGPGPAIGSFSPSEGSTIGRSIPLQFNVTADPSVGALRRVVISVARGGESIEELVHDGTSFSASYTGGSNSRLNIENGFQFRILRLGGWRGSSVSLRIIAIDVFGSVAQKTPALSQAVYTWSVAA